MTVRLVIAQPGLMTTVQDLGRFGAQALGVSVSGALDRDALRVANALVGNEASAAALEIRMLGPLIRVEGGDVRVALVGTQTPLQIIGENAASIPAGQSVRLPSGTVIQIGAIKDSGVCYLAVEGNFDIGPVLGSLSTYLPGGMGGFEGRALRAGDELPLAGEGAARRAERRVRRSVFGEDNSPIRVVPGPQDDYFTGASVQDFLSAGFEVLPSSNRMALQLAGPVLEHSKGYNIASDGIVAGSIQVPGNGMPVVLLADRQTTGGYPKIATVISADLPRLGRLLPGARIRFAAIDAAEAEELRRVAEARLQAVIGGFETVEFGLDSMDRILMRENLIGGVFGQDG